MRNSSTIFHIIHSSLPNSSFYLSQYSNSLIIDRNNVNKALLRLFQ